MKDAHGSQFGEDRILARYFPGPGCCVEVGANDGIHLSNTLRFEQRGWKSVLIEPNPRICDALRRNRSGDIFECAASDREGQVAFQAVSGTDIDHAISAIAPVEVINQRLRDHEARIGRLKPCARAETINVETRRLDDMLDQAGCGPIAFITIDVEGHELEVLRGFTIPRWAPTVLIIEDNSRLRDRRVRDHLRQFGYLRFKRTGVNDWYAKADFCGSLRRLRYGASVALAVLTSIPGIAVRFATKVPYARRMARAVRNGMVARGAMKEDPLHRPGPRPSTANLQRKANTIVLSAARTARTRKR